MQNKQTLDQLMESAWEAFATFKNSTLEQRSELLEAIAEEIDKLGDSLIYTCMSETNLSESRLRTEKNRTCFQLVSYARACREGTWLQIKVDTADNNRTPVKPDIRKMMVPLGPVLVFGASNFPFAFSTAGSDTASALAAGCPVVVKPNPGHPSTSLMVASAIHKAVERLHFPSGVFIHWQDSSVASGVKLAAHPTIKAIGFTGSFAGGKAICDLAWARSEPIPVFAEMSGVNPVFLLPEKLNEDPATLARMLVTSVALGAGQFCTKPGIIIGLAGEPMDIFTKNFVLYIKETAPSHMLNNGIAQSFRSNREKIIRHEGISDVKESETTSDALQDIPTVVVTDADDFIKNPFLQKEVFGTFALIIICNKVVDMECIAQSLHGQLTGTIMGTTADLQLHQSLIETIKTICGRVIVNNVPTGVEVCSAMQHGGPWPSSSNSHYTSVGPDAIQRFTRPLSFQNWPEEMLPDVLKDSNPLQLWRTINNKLTKQPIVANE